MDHNEHTGHDGHAEEHETMTKSKIWKVFFILLGITAVEFVIALYFIPHGFISRGIGNFIYIILTLFKAFYIVAYFMHLKFEKMGLITAVVTVFVFIVYFIALMLTEGSYLHVFMHR